MLATIGSAIGLFAATNIDDIVVLTVLFLASSRGKPRPWQIVAGQYLGFITLVVISVIAALGLTIVPDEWVGFLGLISLGIGIWTLVRACDATVTTMTTTRRSPRSGCGASPGSRSPTGPTTSPSTRRSSAPVRPATSSS